MQGIELPDHILQHAIRAQKSILDAATQRMPEKMGDATSMGDTDQPESRALFTRIDQDSPR